MQSRRVTATAGPHPSKHRALRRTRYDYTHNTHNTNQVVEQELGRIPPSVARRYTQQLWSITYIPQVRGGAAVQSYRIFRLLCVG